MIFVLSIFEWPFQTSFTVQLLNIIQCFYFVLLGETDLLPNHKSGLNQILLGGIWAAWKFMIAKGVLFKYPKWLPWCLSSQFLEPFIDCIEKQPGHQCII